MKATLGLEQIGAGSPEVAEVYRDASGILRHRKLPGRRDYARANKRGTRGIYRWFVVEDGKLYCVRAQTGWTEFDTYYVTAREGAIVRVADWQAWLRKLSASTS